MIRSHNDQSSYTIKKDIQFDPIGFSMFFLHLHVSCVCVNMRINSVCVPYDGLNQETPAKLINWYIVGDLTSAPSSISPFCLKYFALLPPTSPLIIFVESLRSVFHSNHNPETALLKILNSTSLSCLTLQQPLTVSTTPSC